MTSTHLFLQRLEYFLTQVPRVLLGSEQQRILGVLVANQGASSTQTFCFSTYLPTRYQRTLFMQLIYFCFLVAMFPPIVQLHFLHINIHSTHNPSICFDEGLTLETSALKLLTVTNLHYQQNTVDNTKLPCHGIFGV